MKKRMLSFLMALSLLLGCAAGAAAEGTVRELAVGSATAMNGDFFTDMFGANSADIDVRALIHALDPVCWDESQGTYIIDPTVVRSWTKQDSAEGDRTYTLRLWNDLKYSDGSAVTAWDYAFSMLICISPEMEAIGAKIYRNEHILGYDAYETGSPLKGVRVLADDTLAVTVRHEYLPYFYEYSLLMCVPYPIGVIAPGCRVYDDGEGVYIANEDPEEEEPLFTAELLARTVLDENDGYLSHPSVVSGPYTLESFDGVACHFRRNPYYIGKYNDPNSPSANETANARPVRRSDGTTMWLIVPTIERIRFTSADPDTLALQLKNGALDLVNKVVYKNAITQCLNSGLRYEEYAREGLTFVTFTYENPTVNDQRVRQAIAWCMDRDALTKAYCGAYGSRVDGYYGIEKWEYHVVTSAAPDGPVNLDHPKDVHVGYAWTDAMKKSLSLKDMVVYKAEPAKACALLDAAGWTLNRDGEPYDAAKDDVRCKLSDDGELIALDLTLMIPEGNRIADTMQRDFIQNLNACGILLTLVPTEMSDLLRSYYRETERTTDMIYLGTNFRVNDDPAISYSTDASADHPLWNIIYSDDKELYDLAVDMRETEPKDVYGYLKKWVRFQLRYNTVLPAIPVYGNWYFDFWNSSLTNYRISTHTTWTQAILNATFNPGR